jgi:pimeloyl-ACP methyl ester carboxylesterase
MAVRRPGLIAVLVLLGALAAGGVLGLVLVSAGGQPAGSPPPTPSPPTTFAAPTTTSTLPPPDPATTGHAIADAITAHDSQKYAALTCQPQSAAAIDQLQRKWDAAGDVEASMPRPPVVTGDTATVTIHVVGSTGRKDTVFPLHRQGTAWCIPG